MPLSDQQLRDTIWELIQRPGHEQVRVDVRNLLVMHLGAQSADVSFEHQVREVRGRIDALIGRTVFEFKSDLRKERNDAEEQLGRYLPDREKATGQRCVGVATDGADFIRYEFRKGKLVQLDEFKPVREVAPWMQNNLSHLKSLIAPSPALAQDGGVPINGLLPRLAPELRQKVVQEFFLS